MFYLRCDNFANCGSEVGPWAQPGIDEDDMWPVGWVTTGFTEYLPKPPAETEEAVDELTAQLTEVIKQTMAHLEQLRVMVQNEGDGFLRYRAAFCSWECCAEWVRTRTPVGQVEAMFDQA